jgi:hypothetical protein
VIGGQLYCKAGGGGVEGLTLDQIVIEITPPALDFVVASGNSLELAVTVTYPAGWNLAGDSSVFLGELISGVFPGLNVEVEWTSTTSGIIRVNSSPTPQTVDAMIQLSLEGFLTQIGGGPYPVEGVITRLHTFVYKHTPAMHFRGEFQAD